MGASPKRQTISDYQVEGSIDFQQVFSWFNPLTNDLLEMVRIESIPQGQGWFLNCDF